MGDLYASAVGTAVLQLQGIPARPADFDGAVYLGGPLSSEAAIRTILGKFGTIVACEMHAEFAIVRFDDHAAACSAVDGE